MIEKLFSAVHFQIFDTSCGLKLFFGIFSPIYLAV